MTAKCYDTVLLRINEYAWKNVHIHKTSLVHKKDRGCIRCAADPYTLGYGNDHGLSQNLLPLQSIDV